MVLRLQGVEGRGNVMRGNHKMDKPRTIRIVDVNPLGFYVDCIGREVDLPITSSMMTSEVLWRSAGAGSVDTAATELSLASSSGHSTRDSLWRRESMSGRTGLIMDALGR